MAETLEVGKKLVELCKQGKMVEAVNSLYSPDIVSIEAHSPDPSAPTRMQGIAAVKGKNEWWINNHEVHKMEVTGPWPNGDRFVVNFKIDVTPKAGPMAGKRFSMEEAALYTVKNGKIVQEEFFYSM